VAVLRARGVEHSSSVAMEYSSFERRSLYRGPSVMYGNATNQCPRVRVKEVERIWPCSCQLEQQ
jgi:hypothetical protein